MSKNTLIITAIVVALIALGATAVYILRRQEGEEVKEQPVATLPEMPEEPIDWKSYSGHGISFKYPPDFKIEEKEGPRGSFCIKLTSPEASPISSEELRKGIKSLPVKIRYLPYRVQIIHVTPDFLLHVDKFSPWDFRKLNELALTCPGLYSKDLVGVGMEEEEISFSGVKAKKVKVEYDDQILLEIHPISFLYPASKYGHYRIRGSYLKDETNGAFEKTFDLLISTLRIKELIKAIPEALRMEERIEEIKKKIEGSTK